MQEPDGYREANDLVIAVAAESDGALVPYCRVDPHSGAVAEARRALDAGARGIKLHPRAERFTLDVPAVRELVAIAHERRLPVMIHAGRGIPALGRHSLELASEFGDARLILAHGAVSDLAWLWRGAPGPPEPADRHLVVEPRRPVRALPARAAGADRLGERLAVRPATPFRGAPSALCRRGGAWGRVTGAIAGAQMERILAEGELLTPPGPGPAVEPLDPLLERVVSHLVAAVGVAIAEGDPSEQLALATLACAVEEGPHVELCAEVVSIIDRAQNLPAAGGHALLHRRATDRVRDRRGAHAPRAVRGDRACPEPGRDAAGTAEGPAEAGPSNRIR